MRNCVTLAEAPRSRAPTVMVLCNPRDKEAAHRAQMEGIATDDWAAVTCRKCRALLYRQGHVPKEKR